MLTSNSNLQVAPLAGPKNLITFGSWSYDACYKDLVNNKRVLPTGVKTNATIEGCLAAASSAGAQVAGLSYYDECWYSTTLSSDSYVIPETNCRFPCRGNPNESVSFLMHPSCRFINIARLYLQNVRR